jgi:hypothetical protein
MLKSRPRPARRRTRPASPPALASSRLGPRRYRLSRWETGHRRSGCRGCPGRAYSRTLAARRTRARPALRPATRIVVVREITRCSDRPRMAAAARRPEGSATTLTVIDADGALRATSAELAARATVGPPHSTSRPRQNAAEIQERLPISLRPCRYICRTSPPWPWHAELCGGEATRRRPRWTSARRATGDVHRGAERTTS